MNEQWLTLAEIEQLKEEEMRRVEGLPVSEDHYSVPSGTGLKRNVLGLSPNGRLRVERPRYRKPTATKSRFKQRKKR